MDTSNLSYSEAIEELEEIVKAIEDGNIGVDDLTVKVKRGAVLINFCNEKLTKVDDEVKNVLKTFKDNDNETDNF